MLRFLAASFAALATLSACSTATNATGETRAAGAPALVATPSPSPTPRPYRDVAVSFRAVSHSVSDETACADIFMRAHVVVLTVPTPASMWSGPRTFCMREVRSSDSAAARAFAVGVFVPHARIAEDASVSFAGVSRPASSVAGCLAAARSAHVPALAYTYRAASMWSSRDIVVCNRPVNADDSAADDAQRFTIHVPARDIARVTR